jgi:hypothetical protein
VFKTRKENRTGARPSSLIGEGDRTRMHQGGSR